MPTGHRLATYLEVTGTVFVWVSLEARRWDELLDQDRVSGQRSHLSKSFGDFLASDCRFKACGVKGKASTVWTALPRWGAQSWGDWP